MMLIRTSKYSIAGKCVTWPCSILAERNTFDYVERRDFRGKSE